LSSAKAFFQRDKPDGKNLTECVGLKDEANALPETVLDVVMQLLSQSDGWALECSLPDRPELESFAGHITQFARFAGNRAFYGSLREVVLRIEESDYSPGVGW
jgi:hypothetical protein